jgi:hydrogenase maturation protease
VSPAASSVLVIGTGNEQCGDDAAGLLVARAVQSCRLPGVEICARDCDPLEMIDMWKSARSVILIDAMSSGRPPGTIDRFEANKEPLPTGRSLRASTHTMGVPEAIELARSLNRLPACLVVYGIEGKDFDLGDPLSDEVRMAAAELADRIVADINKQSLAGCRKRRKQGNSSTRRCNV